LVVSGYGFSHIATDRRSAASAAANMGTPEGVP
jgi:hypothetical protein